MKKLNYMTNKMGHFISKMFFPKRVLVTVKMLA